MSDLEEFLMRPADQVAVIVFMAYGIAATLIWIFQRITGFCRVLMIRHRIVCSMQKEESHGND